MNDINTLTHLSSIQDQLTQAANNIIIDYKLHFTSEELIKAIEVLRTHYNAEYVSNLIRLTLTTNLRMFIAIMYASLDKTISTNNYGCFTTIRSGICYYIDRNDCVLGCAYHSAHSANAYCTLYDYYEFDITDLQLNYDLRQAIQKHIDSKRVYTKPAVKK